MQTTCAVLTPRVVWCRATAPAGLSKLCQLLALSAWHGIAQERSAGSSIKQISALTHFASAQSPAPACWPLATGYLAAAAAAAAAATAIAVAALGATFVAALAAASAAAALS